MKSVSDKGYGIIYAPPQNMARAHVVSYRLHKGDPTGFVVRHKCDIRSCVNPDHLIIGTQADNVRDRDERQRRAPPKGEMNGRAKLTEDQVKAIRADARKSHFIARDYSTPISTIKKIKSFVTWKHVK